MPAAPSITNDMLKTAIQEGLNAVNYDLTDIDEVIIESIMKKLLPLLVKSKSKSKSTSGKGSSHPNYYAYWHGYCSKLDRPAGPLENGPFRFQQDADKSIPESSKGRVRQLAYHNLIIDNDALFEEFESFEASTIGEIREFLAKHEEFKELDAMNRTSLIWWQFLSDKNRKDFIQWYKERTAETAAQTSSSSSDSETTESESKSQPQPQPPKVVTRGAKPLPKRRSEAVKA